MTQLFHPLHGVVGAPTTPVAEHYADKTQANPVIAPATADTNYTVEEASRWLTCAQPVDRALLAQLGKDCSMYCRIHNIEWTIRPTPAKPWPTERAYPVAVIKEVFGAHPSVKGFLPK